ncbi:hypothetical protein Ae201684P_015882 [Aphanomyces euteiches]|uniref:Tc1-like transposase DDE domain-containing protein n=1 Tax=Aphanomyces euteiches TaxID=100861 RepID=A0A6G0W9U0_9STRA|nr:hypothetical protein Ae201684_017973 [Aphanomyces euteiches]KAH9073982.1 hypothetical protein Ae201684P_015882 [Aphanomyces euteiches]
MNLDLATPKLLASLKFLGLQSNLSLNPLRKLAILLQHRALGATPEDDREIIREAKKNRRVSAEKIKEGFLVYYKELSESTIRRRIKSTGMNGQQAVRSRSFQKSIARSVWRMPKSINISRLMTGKGSFLRTKVPSTFMGPMRGFLCGESLTVMVWGSIGYHGAGSLVFCPSKMNSNDYLEILYFALPDSFVKLDLPVDFIFQQDNAPCHTARRVMEFFDENAFNVLDHPPQSPDLNPIEHVWSYIGRRIRQSPPSSLEGLKTKILHLWNNIPQSFIQGLIDSTPKRLAMVIENKGGATKY